MNEYDFFCFTFFFTLNFFYFFFFFNKVKKRKLLATALFLDKIERKKNKTFSCSASPTYNKLLIIILED